jgi:hypothetical protein
VPEPEVRRLLVPDLPTATREELQGNLKETATLTDTLLLAQLAHLDSSETEKRLLELTDEIKGLTRAAVVISSLAFAAAIAAAIVAILKP